MSCGHSLEDLVLAAFKEALRLRDMEVADRLLRVLEVMAAKSAEQPSSDGERYVEDAYLAFGYHKESGLSGRDGSGGARPIAPLAAAGRKPLKKH